MTVFRRRESLTPETSEAVESKDPVPREQSEPTKEQAADASPAALETKSPTPPAFGQGRSSPQFERVLITLTNRVQQCFERLDSLERRLEEMAESTFNAPSHSDVLEVRIHSAKLAAELARATVELRGEIGMASDEARRAARIAAAPPSDEDDLVLPIDADAEIDIREVDERAG